MATTAATTSPLIELAAQGQSVWYDNISRGLIQSGELQRLINDGVVGITSNPTIFEKAIVASSDYDTDLEELAKGGENASRVFETLALQDISHGADLLRAEDLYPEAPRLRHRPPRQVRAAKPRRKAQVVLDP